MKCVKAANALLKYYLYPPCTKIDTMFRLCAIGQWIITSFSSITWAGFCYASNPRSSGDNDHSLLNMKYVHTDWAPFVFNCSFMRKSKHFPVIGMKKARVDKSL